MRAVGPAVYNALLVALITYAGLCAVLFVFQRSLIYHPRPRAVTAPESTMTLPVEGADLVVTIRPHDGPKALVYFGGNAEDVSLNLDGFADAFPEHALFLPHYRGYGGSTGSPTESALHRDAAALFQRVRAGHAEVALVGRSLGSAVALRLASEAPAALLILVTPFDSLAEVAGFHYSLLPVGWLIRDRYDVGQHAPGIRIPTTVIIAEHDEVIPRARTDALIGRFAPNVATVVVIPGAGHNDLDATGAYRRALRAALE